MEENSSGGGVEGVACGWSWRGRSQITSSMNNDGSARPVNDNDMMPSGVEASGIIVDVG
mgnify:CR=1 FL=1